MNRFGKMLGGIIALLAVPAFATPLDKLQDAFGGTGVDASLWTQLQTHGTVSENGGTLNLTPNANTGAAGLQVESASTYSFTGSQAAVHAVRMPSSAGNVDAQFSVLLDGSNYVQWFFQNGFLSAYSFKAGVKTQQIRLTYSPMDHAWWRIRESAGQVFWETSSDGAVYTVQAAVSTSTLFAISAVHVRFYLETFNTGLASPGQASFANLNLAPSGISPMSSLVDTLGGTSLGSAWTLTRQTAGTAREGGGSLTLAPDANTGGSQLAVTSARPYALTGSSALVNARQVVSAAGNVDNQFLLQIDISNNLQWFFQSGNLKAVCIVNNVRTILAMLPYDASQHAWWRIREASGTVYWETAPDGVNWTQRASIADSALFSLSMLYARFYAETFDTGSASPGVAQYANFNYLRYFVVSGVPSSLIAGVADTVTVEVRDAFGDVATDYTGTLRFATSDPTATIPAPYTFTSSDQGTKSFPSGIVFRTAGDQTLTATDGATMTTTSSVSVTPADAASLVLSALPASAAAGDSLQASVTAFDPYGNVATTYADTVHFSSSDAQAVLPGDATFLPADLGTVTICCVSLRTAGIQTVTVSDALGGVSSNSQSVEVVTGGVSSLQIGGIDATTAGSQLSPAVTVVDAYGNTAPGYRGTVHFASSDTLANLPADYTFTAADAGTRTFLNELMLKTAAVQMVTVTDAADASITGRAQTSVAPGPAALVVLGTPPSATAGLSFAFSVEARDAFGNRATSYLGTVAFGASDGQAATPPAYSFSVADAGLKTGLSANLKTAGPQTLTASDGLIGGSSPPVQVGNAPAQALFVSGFPNPVTAGASGTFLVSAHDAFRNLATDYAGTVAFSSSDTCATLPAAYTFAAGDGGQHSFSAVLCTAGLESISAADTGQPTISGVQTGIHVDPGSAASFIVSGVPSPIAAGTVAAVTVDVRDGSGNRATGYQGTIQFSSSDTVAVLPAAASFTTADQGIKTISGIVLKTPGTQSVTATDGVTTGSQQGIAVQPDVPTWPAGSTLSATTTGSTSAHLAWTAATAVGGVSGYQVLTNGALALTVSGTTLTADLTGLTAGSSITVQVQAGNSTGTWTTDGPTTTVTPLPQDPQLVAPPVDATVPTTLADSTAFLYTGPNPIQTGVAAGTIDAKRVVVLRGTVHDRSGNPLPAAQVTALGHPEFGQTLSRADGAYDLAVNGGSAVVVVLEKPGFLQAQRQVATQWNEFDQVPDAVLVPLDPAATLVDFTNTTLTQVLRGTPTVDDMGERQATVFIPPGTQATLLFEDGSTQPATALHIHATEYTVGASGQKAMPAALPPTSAYTYAVEFTADEAAGAKTIQFSQHVYGYVENFLSFPVGAVVPDGYYDHDLGQWVPQENGRVIEILSVTGGMADVDTDGDGVADDAATLAALGLSNSERERLAATYAVGQTLWRMPMTHFSSVDFNGNPVLGPFPAPGPTTPAPQRDLAPETQCKVGGSIIECQSQTLGEEVPLAGTPYALTYRSSRQLGRRSNYRLNITVPHAITVVPPPAPVVCLAGRTPRCSSTPSGAIPVPVHVYVSVAGQVSVQGSTNPSEPDRIYAYEWDGKDAYGRTLQGEQPIDVRWCYAYPMIGYRTSSAFGRAFAAATGDGSILAMRISNGNLDMENCRTWRGKIGGLDDRARGLGGWSLDVQHVYDGRNRTLYRGDGERASATDVNRLVVNRVAGKNVGQTIPCDTFKDGASALTLPVGIARGMAISAEGRIYFSVCGGQTWRINSDNTITLVATTSAGGFASLAFAADGTLWILDTGGTGGVPGIAALWRLTNSGQLTKMLSVNGVSVSRGYNSEVAVGPDGSVYFSDMGQHCVRKIDADGSVRVVAGIDGVSGFSGDGGPAVQAHLSWPSGLAFGSDGTLYIADTLNGRVRAVRPDGTIRTVLGPVDPGNDIVAPHKLAATRDGTLFVGVQGIIQRVTPDGDVVNVVTGGTGTRCGGIADCPAEVFGRLIASSLAVAPDGSLVGADGTDTSVIWRINSGFAPSTTASEMFVGSKDASQVYVFDATGRHLRTLDALTTAITQQFAYDAAGRLASVTDRAGNVTTVQRDGQGNPTAIVGPFGQTTALTFDGNGYLASITNPNGELVSLDYQPPAVGDGHGLGLLTRMTDARLGLHSMQYDTDGFLTNDTRPDGSSETLARGGNLGATNVTRSTALGRTTTYNVSWNPTTGAETSSIAAPDGTSSTTTTKTDHSVAASFPDGMSVTTTTTPDPRFGMDAFAVSSTTKTPAGLTRTMSTSRSATLASATDPLTLSSLIESVTVNGRTSQSSYNGSTRRMTLTSAAGRVTTMDYDALGRVVQVAPPGVQPLVLHYDLLGRNDSITQGTRVTTMSYRADGFLASIVDPLQRTTSFDYDLVGRTTSTTLPDLSVIGQGYDASGKVTSLTPPGRPAHAFNYTPAALESDYTPPGGTSFNTHTSYNLDQQVSSVSHPDGDFVTPTWDPAKGRLSSFTTSLGTTTLGYSPTTGQVTSVTTPDGVGLTYAYDGALLKTVTSSGPFAGSVQRSYDASFRISSETYGGQTISYGYDNDDLLTSAGAMAITRSSATGFVSGATLGSVTETRAYNAFGEEQSYSSSAGTTPLYSVDYGTRDALGRIVSKTETVQGETHVFGYSYDAQGRLTDVTKDGTATSHYEYDANGNRTVGHGLTASPVYDNQDRLLSYGSCTYAYKADGSLQTKTCPDGATSYDYDAFGNLRHVTLPNGINIDYVIDGQNRRAGKKVNGALVDGFLYRDQLQRSAWLNADGSVKASFVYGGKPNVPEYMVQGGTTYRLITDQVGSVRLVVDSAGNVAERIDYDEFGNVLADSAPGFQPFGFGGGLRDRDMGLTRFGARDYDPVTGRWTTKDPEGLDGGLNVYEYLANDPINHIDPSGDDWRDWDVQWAADLSAGFGDTLTSGFGLSRLVGMRSLTELARDASGAGDVVNKCSGFYVAGRYGAYAWAAVITYQGVQPGGWMNSNRYLRIGFGRFGRNRVFRVAGKVVQWVSENGHWDIWCGGPL